MIQRRQTLFLLQLVFLGIALLFIPLGTVSSSKASENIFLVPFHNPDFISTLGHTVAIFLNFACLILAFTTIFLYKRRELQIKLCYVQMALWLLLGLMIAFCPFVQKTETITSLQSNYFGSIICVVSIVAAYLAARNVKKDIDLLKSADRIR